MIILFNNEMLSALLRTVWSVIRMTPERHLHEVILVDDASNITGECQSVRQRWLLWSTRVGFSDSGPTNVVNGSV